MMLILEIILTILVWNKGWRWKSLIPVGTVVLLGFFYGFFIGLSEGTISPFIILFDVVAVIILAVMYFVKPSGKDV